MSPTFPPDRGWRIDLEYQADLVVGYAHGPEEQPWRMRTEASTEEEVLERLREMVDEEEQDGPWNRCRTFDDLPEEGEYWIHLTHGPHGERVKRAWLEDRPAVGEHPVRR